MYATLRRNTAGTGDNALAWRLAVYEDGRELSSNLTYDWNVVDGMLSPAQIKMRLADLGYTADGSTLVRDGDGFRIDHVIRAA